MLDDVAWAQLWDEDGNVIADRLEDPASAITLTELDPGVPAPPGGTEGRPGRSGSNDRSKFYSGRAVSMTFLSDSEPARRQFLSAVSRFYAPDRRPYLVVHVPEWGPGAWKLQLRIDSPQAPLTFGSSISLVWVNPTGEWESADTLTAAIPGTSDIESGRTYPRRYAYSYGNGYAQSSVLVTTQSIVDTLPKIRVYGPVTNPIITNQTTGDTLKFNYSLTPGHYLSIDCQAGTITEDDVPDASRFGKVDWSISTFFALRPGENLISFTGTGFSTVTQATMEWTEKRL